MFIPLTFWMIELCSHDLVRTRTVSIYPLLVCVLLWTSWFALGMSNLCIKNSSCPSPPQFIPSLSLFQDDVSWTPRVYQAIANNKRDKRNEVQEARARHEILIGVIPKLGKTSNPENCIPHFFHACRIPTDYHRSNSFYTVHNPHFDDHPLPLPTQPSIPCHYAWYKECDLRRSNAGYVMQMVEPLWCCVG